MVLREKVRMLLDEGNDVINFLLLCVETAFSLLCHNKFVTTDTSAVAVQTNIRGYSADRHDGSGDTLRQSIRPGCLVVAESHRM